MFLLSTGVSKASSFALPIYLVFLAATIIGGIYMLIYRRNINKALKENNGRHVSLPDVRSVIIVILIVVLFYGVFSTKSLIKDMSLQNEYMYNEMEYKLDCLESDVENLELYLKEIENSQKIVSSFEYSLDSYDLEKMTVTYVLEAELRTYSDQTKVFVNVDRGDIELSKAENGKYVGKVKVGMFETREGIATMFVTEGEKTISETLDYVVFSLGWKECLPNMELRTISNYEYDEVKHKLTNDPYVIMEVYPAIAGTFTDIYFEIDVKGEGVKKVEFISNADLLQNSYNVDIDEYFPEIYPDTVMNAYMVGIDSQGYIHKHLFVKWEDGDVHMYDTLVDIYDKDGNKLTEN